MTIPGQLDLSELESRFQDGLRDSTVAQATRYRYLQDAYTRIWYMYPWEFRRSVGSVSVSSGVSEYVTDDQVDQVFGIFNSTDTEVVRGNPFYSVWENYADENHVGRIKNIRDIRQKDGKVHLIFQQTPSTTQGHGDVINYYFTKHITHINVGGTEISGNISVSTDVPSFMPQFHQLIVSEALLRALKNKRQFGELYQVTVAERDEVLLSMKKRYLTPRRHSGRSKIYP